MIRKTFIHHDGALGDLLLSLPVISLLKGSSGFIHLAGRSDAAALLLEAGLIDEISSAGSNVFASLYSPETAPELREFLGGFDNAVVFTAREASDAARGISSVMADTRIILTIPPAGERLHVAEFRLCQLTDYSGVSPLPYLSLPPVRTEQAKRYLAENGYDFSRPIFSVHPGSGGIRKCWPAGNYRQLLAMLKGWCDPFFILLSGPAESGAIQAELDSYAANHHGVVHLCGADLPLVAALISMSHLYIGNDSGISHLASSIGTRSMVFFGPTDPLLWKPLGEHVRVVQSRAGCAPCGDEISRGCRERKCLSSVSPESFYAVVREFLSDARFHGAASI